jgi:Fibronectin type III domain
MSRHWATRTPRVNSAMLAPDARNGGLPLIRRVASRLMVPLVAGLTALPAVLAPASPAFVIGSMGSTSGRDCSSQLPCLAGVWHSAADRASSQVVVRLPGAPTAVRATATDGQAEVNWTAPGADDGRPISTYVVTSSPPSAALVVTGGQTHAVINGLPNGERFTFTVAAADSSGQGPPSSPSNGVTPQSLSTFTSTISIRSVSALFNGGACLNQGSQCFGIQQNSFVHTATNEQYWIQNVVFVEDTVRHGWEAEGNYEIWNGAQQAILACSGTITSGPYGEFCAWPMAWRALKFPARINLTSTVTDGNVVLTNSLGSVFPAWSPGPGGAQFIVDRHEMAVPSVLSLYAPETVIVGETGRHTASFNGGSGSIASRMVLADGRTGDPDTQCVAQMGNTSTGESSVGLYWSRARQGGTSLVDFATHGGGPGDGDGVKVLPGSQDCAIPTSLTASAQASAGSFHG